MVTSSRVEQQAPAPKHRRPGKTPQTSWLHRSVSTMSGERSSKPWLALSAWSQWPAPLAEALLQEGNGASESCHSNIGICQDYPRLAWRSWRDGATHQNSDGATSSNGWMCPCRLEGFLLSSDEKMSQWARQLQLISSPFSILTLECKFQPLM